jgi:hypothetical protein
MTRRKTPSEESHILSVADMYLTAWGTWAASADPVRQVGYPGMSPHERLVHKSSGSVPSDDIPERVDMAVSKMTRQEQELARLVYVRRYPVKGVRERLGIGMGKYNLMIYGIKRVIYQEVC